MTDYSGLGDAEKRESVLYNLLIKDLLNKKTQEEIMDYILPATKHGTMQPEDMSKEQRQDLGGALAIATLCEWNCGDKEFALLGAIIGFKRYKSVLCGLIAASIGGDLPIETVKTILIKGHEQLILEKIAQNS